MRLADCSAVSMKGRILLIQATAGPSLKTVPKETSGMANFKLSGWINPLQMLEIDEPWKSAIPEHELTAASFIEFLSTPGKTTNLEQLTERYREISIESPRLFVMPAERGLLTRFLWPLRHAKGAYVMSNYLSTLALSGFVAEMAAILYFRLALEEGVKVRPSVEEFEAMDQIRRIDLLKQLRVLDLDERQAFGRIRAARRSYLHHWTQKDAEVRKTAKQAYLDAAYIVHRVLGLGLKEGVLQMKPAVLRYLQRAGLPMEAVDGGEPPPATPLGT